MLLSDPRAATAIRDWVAISLLTELLPPLLTNVEGRLTDLLQGLFGDDVAWSLARRRHNAQSSVRG
jgi:hypothetical protein